MNVGGHKNTMYLEYWRLQGLPADGAVEDIQLQGDACGVVAVLGHYIGRPPSPASSSCMLLLASQLLLTSRLCCYD